MLPNNILAILFDGAPVTFAYTISEAREFLADVIEDDGDAYEVHEVFNDGTQPNVMTERFARDWSQDCDFGSGDDPEDFLRPFPGYVLAHIREELIETYRDAQEQRENDAFEKSKLRSL